VFCAIVVLYVYVIQHRSSSGRYLAHYLQLGEEAQGELAKCGTVASFPQRYVVVLEELRKEAMRLVGQPSTLIETGEGPQGNGLEAGKNDPETLVPHQVIDDARTYSDSFHEQQESTSPSWMPNFAQDPSPASYLADMTGWGEFDSLVLTGLGEFSHFFPDSEGQY
jgi:hypothetical protein